MDYLEFIILGLWKELISKRNLYIRTGNWIGSVLMNAYFKRPRIIEIPYWNV